MGIKSGKGRALQGKKVALCLTGSIASVKGVELARELMRHGAEMTAYMTDASTRIIHPDSMEFATGRPVVQVLSGKLEHLEIFDLIIAAPATANTIGKIAWGIADNAVTTLILSSRAKMVLAPAMHDAMSENEQVKENLEKLTRRGFIIIPPKIHEGAHKMADIQDIVEGAIYTLKKKDLKGKKVVITGGPTIEYIDPIRIISNRSSGKMGVELAREAWMRGADVSFIFGPGTAIPPGNARTIHVETVTEMLEAVKGEITDTDIFISAAAISDFTVDKSHKKISSRDGELTLNLKPNPKILQEIRDEKALKVGFKALSNVKENELIKAAHQIMNESNLDMVVANDVSEGVFGSDMNLVYIIGKEGLLEHVPYTLKSEVSEKIFNQIVKVIN